MTTKRLFAADLGASGGKCFAGSFERDRFAMKEIHRFSHEGVSFYLPDRSGEFKERMYWDDIFIYRNIVDGLRAFKRDVAGKLDSIGIDTWGADGHFVSEDGEMLGKIHCYRDHRLDNTIQMVKKRIDPRRVYEITGIHFQPFNLSNQIHWFVKNRGDLIRPGCRYLPIPTVFYYYLGGVKAVDSSWASVTQLMDARKKKWSTEILKKLAIPMSVMPEIVEPGAVVGQLSAGLAEATGLNRAKLVAAASHDTASAFAAAPISNPDEALIISSGTWSLVGKLVPEPVTTDAARRAGVSNEGGVGNIRLLKNCMGTWLAQELRRVWRNTDGREMAWSEFTDLAASAKPFGSLIDPDDTSFYNPANMEKAIAAFCSNTGQAVPADRGAFIRTVYESLALKYRAVNEQISEVCGKTSRVVHIVGGGSKNEMLNQFTADAMGLPVLAGPEEATAVGNMMVQAMGLGIIESIPAAMPLIKHAFPIKQYTPADEKTWEKAYKRFRSVLS
ncbi:MAG: FGGY-family carbohydrate kinase [bacterium]